MWRSSNININKWFTHDLFVTYLYILHIILIHKLLFVKKSKTLNLLWYVSENTLSIMPLNTLKQKNCGSIIEYMPIFRHKITPIRWDHLFLTFTFSCGILWGAHITTSVLQELIRRRDTRTWRNIYHFICLLTYHWTICRTTHSLSEHSSKARTVYLLHNYNGRIFTKSAFRSFAVIFHRNFPAENFRKFPEIYSDISENFLKFVNYLCQ